MAGTLGKRRVEDIKTIASIPIEKMSALLLIVEAKQKFHISIEDFIERVAEIVGDDADAIGRFVVGVRRALDETKGEAEQYLADLLSSTEEDLAEAGLLDAWIAKSEILQKVLDSETAIVLAKSSELYYLASHHLHSFKIITDVRPVFSADLKESIAHIVKNHLYIRISDDSENEQLMTVSIGLDDIRDLLNQANRALTKTQTLVEEAERGKIPVRVYDV